MSGRLSDLLGRKRIFQIGLALFGLMSLMVGVSQNAFEIIAARAVQGIGSSIIMAQTSDFHYQTAWMAGFSVISTIIVYIFIYQNGRKSVLD